MAKKKKVDWVKRQVAYKTMDAMGSFNFGALHMYERLLRIESAGLTEKERLFMQAQLATYKKSIENLSKLRERLYKSLNEHSRARK